MENIEVVKNMCGGEGTVKIKHILGEKELNGKCGLYAEVTIGIGSSLGYHEHHGESETYYILSGEAEYDDNGTTRIVKTGDVTFTPDNHGHALKPIGTEPVVFMALIIKD
ncbi:MAG: cupin domain-containing protein [Clostridia bacterium]|nr:cupin domain-containing protein [Clostridia bacterium]NCC43988.1 cupin domain-containing protein [Clostridia bacterium]